MTQDELNNLQDLLESIESQLKDVMTDVVNMSEGQEEFDEESTELYQEVDGAISAVQTFINAVENAEPEEGDE